MYIQSIELSNYRNYRSLEMEFDRGTNILFGDNAQGKTNILESIYLSGTSRSHRTARDRELIRFGQEEAHIRTNVCKNDLSYCVDIHIRQAKSKGIAINGVPVKKASDLFGLLGIIFFSPEDLNIVKNGPAERRHFIDAELSQIDRIYLSDLSNYNKALNQRNSLLKGILDHPELRETLDVWDGQLVSYGKRLIARRREFIADLIPIVRGIHRKLSGGIEDLLLAYEPNIDDTFFEDELFRARDRDMRMGTTTVGPHRDDLKLSIASVDIRRFGSQGQQRTCALSLKLAEIQMMEAKRGEKPILLLDDVLSELDSNRQNYLLESINDIQTIISCTGLDEFVKNKFSVHRVYEISNGQAFLREKIAN